MRANKLQFFILYGVLASLQPYLPIYLAQQGLDDQAIGFVLSAGGWAIMLSPVLATLIADIAIQPRRVTLILYILMAVSMFGLIKVQQTNLLFLFNLLCAISYTAIMPLQDGINFALQKDRGSRGLSEIAYNIIRAWGTFGFVFMLLLLFFPLQAGWGLSMAIGFGGLYSFLGVINSLFLPDRGRRESAKRRQGLPTFVALRVLAKPINLAFCLSMLALIGSTAAYFAFYPRFLNESLGLEKQWVGIVSVFGVLLESIVMLNWHRIERRWGMRRLMLFGVFCIFIRYFLLFSFPNLTVAIGTQILHGITICTLMVLPPSFLNRQADDDNRNSIQGVYAMLILGTGRVAGSLLSGIIAEYSIRHVFLFSGCCAALGFTTLLIFFRPKNLATPS